LIIINKCYIAKDILDILSEHKRNLYTVCPLE
jgi:hypothetical protein